MHDPDHEHNLDAALAERAYTLTDDHGRDWRFQPDRLNLPKRLTSHLLIIMEQSDGPYEPVGSAVDQDEALELIADDYHRRSPENGDLCPEHYALWNRDPNGHYRRAATITKA